MYRAMPTMPQHRTARRFKNPPPLFRWAKERGFLDLPGRALVFGAGLLLEAEALLDLGWQVNALETESSILARPDLYASFDSRPGARVIKSLEETKQHYRAITVTHVLEFIPEPRERTTLLSRLANLLTTEGILLLSLRGWSDVNASKTKQIHRDGIITGLGTFTRGYSMEEAQELLACAGLKVTASPHGERARTPEQVRLLCQRS